MGKYYRPPKTTGNEYVQKSEEFLSYVVLKMSQMPPRLEQTTTKYVAEAARSFANEVRQANAIYIPAKDKEPGKFREAICKRQTHLYRAIQYAKVFDAEFDRMMMQIDLAESEAKRIRGIIQRIVEENNEAVEALLPIELKTIQRWGGIQYTAGNKTTYDTIHLTTQQRDRILMLEKNALDAIDIRLKKDNRYLAA